jgi:uncharacterized protein
MHFPTLMAECDPSAELSREVDDLMRRKLVTRELGAAPLPPIVASFIDSEFELARASFESGRARASEDVVAQAERFYRAVVERLEREGDGSRDMPEPA